MGLIKIYQGKSKGAKKKPGWQKEQQEYQEWLKRVNSMTLGVTKPKKKTTRKIDPVVRGPVIDQSRIPSQPHSTSFGNGTKEVLRPEILYKDDPEMLARELAARERKFATAPAYNKGGDVLVTDEMMKDITAGRTRRR
jgi:hypothetical protein